MVERREYSTVLLVILVLVLWAAYFAVCAAPVGAPFIYVDF